MPELRKTYFLRRDLMDLLSQGQRFVTALGPRDYNQPLTCLNDATIGDHYRHHLDYVDAFCRGVTVGSIDYSDRRRDCAVAADLSAASQHTDRLQSKLAALNLAPATTSLNVTQQICADDDSQQTVPTTLCREFFFVMSHSVHHFAIAAMAARLLGHTPPSDLGVMGSTQRHRESNPVDPEGDSPDPSAG